MIVSIRTPRAGRDLFASGVDHEANTGFYPHAPGGARRRNLDLGWSAPAVSIRTPRAGRDLSSMAGPGLNLAFLSARPGRGATG